MSVCSTVALGSASAFVIESGRQKVADVFGGMPHRRHVVVSTTYADYLCALLKCAHPRNLDWLLAQARRVVACAVVCRRHNDGEFTRLFLPIFAEELSGLAALILSDEEQTERMFNALTGPGDAIRLGDGFRRGAHACDLSWVMP